MNSRSQFDTPKSLKMLLYITAYASIIFALIDSLFFKKNGFLQLLSLSWNGIKHYYFWQPVTYFFINTIENGITLSWLFNLAMGLYFIWFLGTHLIENFGEKAFLKFYLISGIFTGLLSIIIVPFTGKDLFLSGQASVILSILTVWLMKNKNSRLYIFHLLPIKTQTLIFIILGFIFLYKVDDLNLITFLYYIIAILIGYFYGLCIWNLHSPFPNLYNFEKGVHQFSWRLSSYFIKK